MVSSPDIEAQQETLEAILRSRTFHRSEQLKRFLRYVCEAEWQGSREHLTEYDIGVNALGRPKDFSPDIDSSVRTRAHSLRQKLEEYYAGEGQNDRIRMELPRGSYIPVFQVRLQAPAAEPCEMQIPTPEAAPVSRASRLWPFAAGLMTAIIAGVLLFGFDWIQTGNRARMERIVLDFWQPWSQRAATICVSQPPQVWIRDYHQQPPPVQYEPFPDAPPSSEQFLDWYRRRVPLHHDSHLVIHPSPNSALWGDAAGGARAAQFLASMGTAAQILPETTLTSSYPLRQQNLMVFGRPEFSTLMREQLPKHGYTVDYLPEVRRHAIVHRSDPKRRYFNSLDRDEANYGLITVLSAGSDQPRSTILFAGITSDGSLAGIEFMTSPRHLQTLRDQMRGHGQKDWPSQFQVVIRARSSEGYPVSIDYVEYVALQ